MSGAVGSLLNDESRCVASDVSDGTMVDGMSEVAYRARHGMTFHDSIIKMALGVNA